MLTGGGAVCLHTTNRYCSYDIDFVTAASCRDLVPVMASLGFTLGAGRRFETPTPCVKDRLAAFYHWRDVQGLEQAVMVARDHRVSVAEIERWSKAEGHTEAFGEFRKRLRLVRGGSRFR